MATNGNHDFESRGPLVLAVTAAMFVCSTVFVALRLIARFWVVRRSGWDDYTIILAWVSDMLRYRGSSNDDTDMVLQVLALGTSIAICYGTSVGLGRHEVDVPADWASTLKKCEYIFAVLYVGIQMFC